MVTRAAEDGGRQVPHLRVVSDVLREGDEAEDLQKTALVERAMALMEAYVVDCLSRDGGPNVAPETPKPRVIDGGERFLFAGEKCKSVDYLGRMQIAQIGCLEEIHAGRKVVNVSSQKTPAGDTMAIFSRYPVAVDGWDRDELGHYKMGTLNLCELLEIPHTNADFARARENGRHGHDVLVKGLGHFAVVLPRGKRNSLNLAPLSEYPKDVLFALNQRINMFLRQHPEYAKVLNGRVNGIPQFGEEDLKRILGR